MNLFVFLTLSIVLSPLNVHANIWTTIKSAWKQTDTHYNHTRVRVVDLVLTTKETKMLRKVANQEIKQIKHRRRLCFDDGADPSIFLPIDQIDSYAIDKNCVSQSRTKQALKDSRKIHYLKGEMDAEFQIGRVYVDQARRVLALESGTLSLKIAEEIDNYDGIKNALNLISKIHNHANDINEGIKEMRKLLNLALIENDSTQIALSYNFLGIFKNKVNEPDSSYYFTNQSMIINRKLKNEKSLAYNYNSLGIYHYGKSKSGKIGRGLVLRRYT